MTKMTSRYCYSFRPNSLFVMKLLLVVACNITIQRGQLSLALSMPRTHMTNNGLPLSRSVFRSTTVVHATTRNSDGNKDECRGLSRRRRMLFQGGVASVAAILTQSISSAPASASETIGKDPNCNDSTCLGVWDGLLADCPHTSNFMGGSTGGGGAGCTSSQDDTPGIFSEPWDYSDAPSSNFDLESQMNLLVSAIQLVSSRRGDKVTILVRDSSYLRVLFQDGKSNEKSVGEFYFTENDTTVQYRLASLGNSGGGSLSILSGGIRNMERSELIRKELKYLKVPVIRNRQRTLLFFESDLDTFGPGSAALGSPAGLSAQDFDSDRMYPKFKLDATQQFPMQR